MDHFANQYLSETIELVRKLDASSIEALAKGLAGVRENGGRLFILGGGGSAGHASHAVNDFPKLCAIESYPPPDNVRQLTARVNAQGGETRFSQWLPVAPLRPPD